ncbi:MAG: putative lipid II flippase FtsW [Methylococcales symbiont of Iophon sp. n. MRB-2018]|nr:MAG: putative lipid II flippase FtsW [Methylococcales symbiont of Iophon sp. n. MRB-2018]KAF3979391.1 MAG: putative lipid II flippase FtsW [Methylococcales symbiont of Iophon sp. n. MRB-2018]
MNSTPKQQQKTFYMDYFLLCICTILLIIGFIMVTSSSLHLGEELVNNSLHYPLRQIKHIILGIGIAAIICCIPLKIWEKIGPWIFIGGIALLIIVLIPGGGVKVNGSVRWISIAGLRLQVSEVVKFASVVYIASYVTRHQEAVLNSTYGLVKPLLLFSLACFFLLLEPDFGSAVVILVIAMGVMYLSGARLWQFIVLISIITVLGILLVYFSPYRWARITGFINPWADAQNTGFQLVHALISFGRGEIFGVGLGRGIQKLFYLPEAHTDFLFSVLAEELGLMGVLVVISLFILLLGHAFSLAVKAEQLGEKFAAFIAYGVGIWFGFQAFINMGVNMGMLPTKGLTLPLMSYGGGSMITMCAAMALLFRVHSEITVKQKQTPKGNAQWINI